MKHLFAPLPLLTSLLLLTGTLAFAQSPVTYIGPDSSTVGNWIGVYGGDGYQTPGTTSLPSYASVSFSGAANYSWAAETSDARALETSPGNYLPSIYYGNPFSINVSFNDSNTHTVALYLLDWETGGQRTETVTILNSSGAQLNTQTFQNFGGGVWAVWKVNGSVGSVTIQVASTNQYLNAAVSGIFFSPSGSSLSSQTITFNSISNQTVGTPLTLSASASSGLTVAFASTTPSVCTVSGTSASFAAAGTCSITASQAGNSSYAAATPVTRSFTVNNAPGGGGGGALVSYVGPDTSTVGNWIGVYGGDGYQTPGSTHLPSYASVSVSGATIYSWAAETTDPRALETSACNYLPSIYYGNPFSINVSFNDSNTHTVALYLLDWETGGQRNETVTILNSSGAQLDTHTFQNFGGGVWAVWKMNGSVGSVTIQVQSNNQYLNAAVSGIFFSPAGSASPARIPNANNISPSLSMSQAKVTVFSNSQWLSETLSQSATSTVAGSAGTSALGDYDGDGLVDAVVFQDGAFQVTLSSNGSSFPEYLGIAGDIAVPGDYDGDGKIDFAVFRPSNGVWYYLPSSNPAGGVIATQTQALSDDTPVPGDYDGDGKTDFAFFRPSVANFFVILSTNPGTTLPVPFGNFGDIPAVGDYDGDGKTDFAIFRPATSTGSPSDAGTWYYRLSSNYTIVRAQPSLGNQPGDKPVAGDYDGDGHTDFAVWRPSSQTWYIILSSNLGTNIVIPMSAASSGATALSLTPYTTAPGVSLSARQTPGAHYTISGAIQLNNANLLGVSVTLANNGSPILQMATDSNGTYSFTVPTGDNYTVTPVLAGYTFSPSPTATFSNLSADQLASFTASATAAPGNTITFNSIPTQTVGTPLALSASASSGLAVTFTSNTTSVCTVSGTTASFLTAGTCTIQAAQQGNGTYPAAATVNQSFTVNAAAPPPGATSTEYIYFNGQIVAIEHPN